MPIEFWPTRPPPSARWTLDAFDRVSGEHIGSAYVEAPADVIAQAVAAALERQGIEASTPEVVMCYGLDPVDAELIEFLRQYTDDDLVSYRLALGMSADWSTSENRPRVGWGEWASDDPDDRSPGPGRYFLPPG
jgi:hypothetical protein